MSSLFGFFSPKAEAKPSFNFKEALKKDEEQFAKK
jgi:hypothetical protein